MIDKEKNLIKMLLIIASILSALISIFVKDGIESLITGGGPGIIIYRILTTVIIGTGIGFLFSLFVRDKTEWKLFSYYF